MNTIPTSLMLINACSSWKLVLLLNPSPTRLLLAWAAFLMPLHRQHHGQSGVASQWSGLKMPTPPTDGQSWHEGWFSSNCSCHAPMMMILGTPWQQRGVGFCCLPYSHVWSVALPAYLIVDSWQWRGWHVWWFSCLHTIFKDILSVSSSLLDHSSSYKVHSTV